LHWKSSFGNRQNFIRQGGEEDGFPPFSSSFLSFYPKIYVLLPMSSLCHVSCVRLACLWTGFEKEDWKALKRNE